MWKPLLAAVVGMREVGDGKIRVVWFEVGAEKQKLNCAHSFLIYMMIMEDNL